ncbi:hypothetical protein MATL_G00263640 [Megalops atlanticus]|uniref:Uncharacterized protein n=1 Tax=Megalops atlanticus TaxID=7932 RepID=A0A9D3P972_MEGAT|nr:hypothetical protein MATL_G00263640 [Megalops atlanticus]
MHAQTDARYTPVRPGEVLLSPAGGGLSAHQLERDSSFPVFLSAPLRMSRTSQSRLRPHPPEPHPPRPTELRRGLGVGTVPIMIVSSRISPLCGARRAHRSTVTQDTGDAGSVHGPPAQQGELQA